MQSGIRSLSPHLNDEFSSENKLNCEYYLLIDRGIKPCPALDTSYVPIIPGIFFIHLPALTPNKKYN